jgi:hypothetical protein
MPSVSEQGIVQFSQFVESLSQLRPESYLNVPHARIANEAAFNEMNAYLADYYAGAEAVHSFVDANGSVFDCMPVEKQYSVRSSVGGQTVARAPDLPTGPEASRAPASPARAIVQLHPDVTDQFGNRMYAPDGTIPVRRKTPEDLARFRTLREYFQKSPTGGGQPPKAGGGGQPPSGGAGVAATHRWAHAYQAVNNLGGGSFLNVWDPSISANQIFSLSQHWYVGGSGAGLQTAECGWQVYPQMYGNTKPCLFIYWTADDYQTTGCYNLSCNAFVQTNKNWALGGALAPWSVAGGTQYELDFAYYLYQGNWWLYLGGEAAANAVGYYPTSIYRGGAMVSHAAEIDYGGETVGTTSWPPMGSGAFANTGWQHAAYQRQIHYFPTSGGRLDAALTATTTSPNCYTAIVTKYNPPWSETLWFGGPGGTTC